MAKIKEIRLATQPAPEGGHCVKRTPPSLQSDRRNLDIVRIVNTNPAGSGLEITVIFDPLEAAKLFDPVPQAETTLQPGQSMDIGVRDSIAGVVGIGYDTIPGDCRGADEDDIVVKC